MRFDKKLISEEKHEAVDIWRPEAFPGTELRRGFNVLSSAPRHWHDEYQLCVIRSGSGELSYRRDKVLNPAGSFYVVHPGEIHSTQSFESCDYEAMYIDPELIDTISHELFDKRGDTPFFKPETILDRQLIGDFIGLFTALSQPASLLERQTVLRDVIAGLLLKFGEARQVPVQIGREQRSVERVREFLTESYSVNVSLATLAEIANLSPYHLNRVFAAETGLPPHAFQIRVRLSRARKLLRAGHSIREAAYQTGFADQSHLTRHFKRVIGVTPGQYVQKSKNIQDIGDDLLLT